MGQEARTKRKAWHPPSGQQCGLGTGSLPPTGPLSPPLSALALGLEGGELCWEMVGLGGPKGPGWDLILKASCFGSGLGRSAESWKARFRAVAPPEVGIKEQNHPVMPQGLVTGSCYVSGEAETNWWW